MSDPHTAIAERLEEVARLIAVAMNRGLGRVKFCAGDDAPFASAKAIDALYEPLLTASADEVEQLRKAHRDADEQWGLASRAHVETLEELECLRAGSGKTELKADFVRALPGGRLDDATYEAIESALDKAEAPCQLDGRWLTLPERVAALQWDRDSLAKSFVESNREIRRIQAEADRAGSGWGELHLLEEVCAFYADDEDAFLNDEGEPYGGIPTEVGMKARAARKRFRDREALAQASFQPEGRERS